MQEAKKEKKRKKKEIVRELRHIGSSRGFPISFSEQDGDDVSSQLFYEDCYIDTEGTNQSCHGKYEVYYRSCAGAET